MCKKTVDISEKVCYYKDAKRKQNKKVKKVKEESPMVIKSNALKKLRSSLKI